MEKYLIDIYCFKEGKHYLFKNEKQAISFSKKKDSWGYGEIKDLQLFLKSIPKNEKVIFIKESIDN